MTPAELRKIGEAIYGAAWMEALSRDLHIRDGGRLSQMARGLRQIPDGFRAEILQIACRRADDLDAAIIALENSEPNSSLARFA